MSMKTTAKVREFARKARGFARALITRTLEFEFERMPYRLEGISNTKLLTLFRQELNCARPSSKPPWYPVQLQIEPSSACDLHCNLCPAGMGKGGVMPFSTLRALIDEVGDHAIMAIFWMWGEPFVNPKLPDMIAYAKSKNMGTVTSTNGQHVQTKEDAERLVASGLDSIFVATDGATQESYGQYRIGGDLQKVIRCIDLIRRAKASLGSETPRVNVRTVVTRHNEHELPEIERIARQHGADVVSRKTACVLDYSRSDKEDQFAPENAFYRRYEYRNGKRVIKPASNYRCRRIWNRITLASDGTMVPCEFDHSRIAALGRYEEGSTFMQIWKGERAATFRRQFTINRMVYPFCMDCPLRDRLQSECTIEVLKLGNQEA